MENVEKFSESEMAALKTLSEKGGGIILTQIPDKNEKDFMGFITAGMTTYKKLIKKGLCFITEEEPLILDNGEEFLFTPSVEFTEEGLNLMKRINF